MQTFSDANKVQVGDIAGVITWPAKSFEDSRGVFFKPFSVLDLEEFKVSFETVEHFFTVSKKMYSGECIFRIHPTRLQRLFQL